MSINVIVDRIPELIARMGRLSIDSPISECLSIRRETCVVNKLLKTIPRKDELGAKLDLIRKIRKSPEYCNYREILKGLQLGPGLRSMDELLADLDHVDKLLQSRPV